MKTKPFNLDECMTKYGGRCVTTDLDEVEIVKTDLNGADSGYPLLVIITAGAGGWQEVSTYRQDGRYDVAMPHPKDLQLILQTEELFLVIVRDKLGGIYHGPSEIHRTLRDAEEAREAILQEDLLPSITHGLNVTIHQVEIEI